MGDDGTKTPQPPEAGSRLNGDPYADLTLEAIRECEYMLLLEGEPHYGDNVGRPAEQATTADAAQHDPPPPPPDRVIDCF